MSDSKYVISILLDRNWKISGDVETMELGFPDIDNMYGFVDKLVSEKGLDIDQIIFPENTLM